MERPLIVATDFSAHADEALRYAQRFASAHDALHLLHVFAWQDPELYGLSQSELERANQEGHVPEILGGALREAAARAGLDPDTLTLAHRRSVDVGAALADYVREVQGALLVVGTHGRRGWRRFSLGSVASKAAREAPCDVLVVPLNEQAPWSGRPMNEVLAPVDLTAVSARQVNRASEIADLAGAARVEILHVVEPYPYAWLHPDAPLLPPDVERWVEGELMALATEGAPNARRLRAAGSPAQEILSRAAKSGADLIVIASHDPVRRSRFLIGSTTERVLRAAERPVLVVRAEAPQDEAEVAQAEPAQAEADVPEASTRRATTAPAASGLPRVPAR